ncbi:hypothetical protein YB2330_001813 [Saitoella coloradoensis]
MSGVSLHPPRGPFQKKDTLMEALKGGATMGVMGLAVSAMKNHLQTHNHGGMGVFTRTGSLIGWGAAIGTSFTFFSSASANLRETEDAYNAFIGGFMAGAVAGLKKGKITSVVGMGALIGSTFAVVDWCGGSYGSIYKEMTEEEKEEFKNKWFTVKRRYYRAEAEEVFGKGRVA